MPFLLCLNKLFLLADSAVIGRIDSDTANDSKTNGLFQQSIHSDYKRQRDNLERHTTNLTLYSEIADETERLTKHFPLLHIVKLLNSYIMRMRTLLTTLEVHHRHARSINVIGTALKIIA